MAENRGGNYTVTVTKPGWTSDSRRVNVPGGSCGYVETQNVRFEISLLPSAPPVRSVAVQPRSVRFGFCGSGAQATAYVDADDGIDRTVTWRSADTTVATVSDKGVVSDKSRGTTKIFARSVADPRVEGSVSVQVDPTCP
ncbi:MAG: Ig-like domain-containing protein [Solirubrobacteraceae bacterium]